MERRVCPDCKRLLSQLGDMYLCNLNCWKLFSHEETLPHPRSEVLCSFIEKPCEVGVWLVCVKCSKAVLMSNEWIEEKRQRFLPEYVQMQRQEIEEIQADIEFAFKRKEDLVKAFEQMMAGTR